MHTPIPNPPVEVVRRVGVNGSPPSAVHLDAQVRRLRSRSGSPPEAIEVCVCVAASGINYSRTITLSIEECTLRSPS